MLGRRSRAFAANCRGGVSYITGLSATVLIGFTGLATDFGAIFLETRRLQGAVDIAALEAAGASGAANSAASQSLERNGFAGVELVVERGAYTPTRAVAPDRRFVANAPGPNAVRVSARTTTELYFGRIFVPSGTVTISRQATAAQSRLAAFEIGSRLLSLNGGVANAVLGGLTGSSVNLSVMDYNALLSADVELLSFIEALRTRLDLEAASFEEVLSAQTDAPTTLEAIADALGAQDRRAETAMRRLAASAREREVKLDELIDLGPMSAQDRSAASGSRRIEVGAMSLASAVLQMAGGSRQIELDLGASLPGLTETKVWLAIGERPNRSPWLAITGSDEIVVRTTQMRLYISADVQAAAPLASLRVPVLIEIASAQARLGDVRCDGAGQRGSVTLEAAPAAGSLSLGEIDVRALDNFRTPLRPSPAQLIRATSLIRVEGSAHVAIGGEQWQSVRFSAADIAEGRVKRVATRDAVRASVSSLLGATELDVRVAGLGLGLAAVTNSTRGALTTAATPLDNLVNGIEDILGLHIGEADLRVNGVRCGGAVLVG